MILASSNGLKKMGRAWGQAPVARSRSNVERPPVPRSSRKPLVRRAVWWAVLLGVAFSSLPCSALDSLVIGRGSVSLPWTAVSETAEFIDVAGDSVWLWPAERGQDLVPGALARGGRIGVKQTILGFSGPEEVLAEVPGLERWIDGEPLSAWGPDDNAEIDRQIDVYIDLGGTFRVDGVRLGPRLDRQNVGKLLGAFTLGTNEGTGPPAEMLAQRYRTAVSFSAAFPNRQPLVEARFTPRDVRYLRLSVAEDEAWELADIAVFGTGSVRGGQLVSIPIFVRGGFPVWGRVRADGAELETRSLSLQTRTGPDDEPLHYFVVAGDEVTRVSAAEYRAVGLQRPELGTVQIEPGPILPNPAWSPWQTVTDGQVLSPGPRRYMQFRLGLAAAGTRIERLVFEYITRPILDDLAAEIRPVEAEAGVETDFTLSMLVRLDELRGDTGLRYLEVQTPAEVTGVRAVRVDDQEAVYSAVYPQAGGFVVDLWQRVLQEGSFVEVDFGARVFRDGTLFRVRALDLRPELDGIEVVYQSGRPEDVEPLTPGGTLAVRLRGAGDRVVDLARPRTGVLTPNGDGVNDRFELAFNLLKLVQPAAVGFEVWDLGGRRVYEGAVRLEASGAHTRVWDGRDGRGQLVGPGLYFFRVRAQTDRGTEEETGTLRVAY